MQFAEHLSGFPVSLSHVLGHKRAMADSETQGSKGRHDTSYWDDFVRRFFSQKGIFRHIIRQAEAGEPNDKQYEITYPALARYFHTHFDSGVKSMQLVMAQGTTDKILPDDCHWVENTRASLTYWFEDNSHVSLGLYIAWLGFCD